MVECRECCSFLSLKHDAPKVIWKHSLSETAGPNRVNLPESNSNWATLDYHGEMVAPLFLHYVEISITLRIIVSKRLV